MPAIIDAMKISSRIQPPPGDGRNLENILTSHTLRPLPTPAARAEGAHLPIFLPDLFRSVDEHRPDRVVLQLNPGSLSTSSDLAVKRGSELTAIRRHTSRRSIPGSIQSRKPHRSAEGFNPGGTEFAGRFRAVCPFIIDHKTGQACPPPSLSALSPPSKYREYEDPPFLPKRQENGAQTKNLDPKRASPPHIPLESVPSPKGTTTRRLHHPTG